MSGDLKEILDQLAVPFPSESIGKKPTVWCKPCRDKKCEKHKPRKCGECKQTLTSAHSHLDFVGHAYVRERLNQVDPHWNWKPLAFAPTGLPYFDDNGGLWIELTIGGKTHLGYGDAPGKRGGDAIKEVIGDALRNAGQSFGIALEMWKGGARAEVIDDIPERQVERPAQTEEERKTELRGQIAAVGTAKGMSVEEIAGEFYQWSMGKMDIHTASARSLDTFLKTLRGDS